MKKKIIILGKTPAAAMCSIYLKTANIDCSLILYDCNNQYNVTVLPGIDDLANFTNNTFLQAKNLHVPVINKKIQSIYGCNNNHYIITFEDNTQEIGDVLVIESNRFNIENHKTCFNMTSSYHNTIYEAIELAGIGCQVALDLKNKL